MLKRVVITGIGILSPLGNTPQAFIENAIKGKSCIRKIRKLDASPFPVQIGGELDLSGVNYRLPEDELEEMSNPARWSVLAAREAVKDAHLDIPNANPYSIDVITGVSISALESLKPEFLRSAGSGMGEAPPKTVVLMNPAASAVQICRDLGIQGESANITTACSSTTSAIGYALRLIQHGESTCVLTGGADEGISPLFLGALGNSSHLSHRNSDPEHASRPFDRLRDGYVLSDAACILVLEEFETAKARGARVYCEITGYGATNDAATAFKVYESEEPSAHAVARALMQSRRTAAEVDYFCALGVAVPMMDIRETRMIKRVFKEHTTRLAVSSIKSMMGHPLGAAGAIQAATCALAIQRQAVPPTINYENPDPDCDLDYVPNQARPMRIRNAMLYTLGNAGFNASLTLSAC